MNITVTSRWEDFISTLLQAGDYTNKDEVIEEAFKALEEKRAEQIKMKKLKDDLQQGIDSLDNGEGIVADDNFFSEVVKNGVHQLTKHSN